MDTSVEPQGEAASSQELSAMSGFAKTLQAAAEQLNSGGEKPAISKTGAQEQVRETIRSRAEAQVPDGDLTDRPRPAAAARSRVPDISAEMLPKSQTDGSAMDALGRAADAERKAKRRDYNKAQRDQSATQEDDEPKPAATVEPAKETAAASAPAASATTQATVAKVEAEQPVTMADIDAALADPNISARHRRRMEFLAKEAKRASELETKLKDLESRAANATSTEEYKKLSEKAEATERELLQYRRLHEAQDLPEIKEKYDNVIKGAGESINSKLKEMGVSDAMVKMIDEKFGGFASFSKSKTLFNVPVKGDGGETQTKQMTAAELAKTWLDSFPVADAEFVKAKLQEQMNLTDAKGRELTKLKAEAETHFRAQREQQEKATREQQEKLAKLQADYVSNRDKWLANQAWLKDRDVPSDASPELAKEIEEFNKGNALARKMWDTAANPQSVEEFVGLVSNAAQAVQLQREIAALRKENETLKSNNERLAKGSVTTSKGGSQSLLSAQTKKKPSQLDHLRSGSSALDNIMASAEALRNGGGDE